MSSRRTISQTTRVVNTVGEERSARSVGGWATLRSLPGRFDLQPILRGELLELRPLRDDDFPALFAVASDPLIWQLHPASDRYREEVFREFFREGLESG